MKKMKNSLKIGLTINDTIRDFTNKFINVYNDTKSDGVVKANSSLDPYNLQESGLFKDDKDIVEFLYQNSVLDIFGFSDELYKNCINDLNHLNEFLHNNNIELILLTKEVYKAKPATLHFLSKYGCELNHINFVYKDEEYFDYCDILITPNYKLFDLKKDKKVVKFETRYNYQYKNVDYTIKHIKEIFDLDTLKKELKINIK